MSASGRGEDEYKRTLYDKHGPEAAHLFQTASSVIIPVVAGGLIGAALAAQKGLSSWLVVLSALAGAVILGTWWWLFVTRVSRGAGKALGAFIQPSAAGSYERQYSHQDSAGARGRCRCLTTRNP